MTQPELEEDEVIYLQPWCGACDENAYASGGRLWCHDDIWGECEDCGRKPVKYKRVKSE